MEISGHTTPYAVLGHPIGHSLSPAMHNASLQALGMDAIYLAFDVRPERLMAVLPAMRDMGFGGVNLTVPLKEVAFRGLKDLDVSARRAGAVNTVEFTKAGTLRGHGTDGAGFLLALREAFGTGVRGRSVFVLGSGGAGRTLAIVCAAQGARRVLLTDIEVERAAKVREEIAAQSPDTAAEVVPARPEAWAERAAAAELVLQCTPVGMRQGDRSPLGPEAFRPGQCAYDLVYMYPETPFMAAARAAGARAANGLGMLLHQGAQAFRIWTGREPDIAAMRTALERRVYGTGTGT